MTQPNSPITALITGASSGIGATYADRLAKRGHPLVIVARDAARLGAVAARITAESGVSVEVLAADLASPLDLERVETRLREDPTIGVLVNCAGLGPSNPALATSPTSAEAMIRLNVIAAHGLALAAGSAFAARGAGAIINLASVVALAPEMFNATYSATKAFMLSLTQGLHTELAPRGVRIQAVLPGLTRTEIFERAGFDVKHLDPAMIMEVGDMVDAALAGFDAGELITIPSLPDVADWQAFEFARAKLGPNLSLSRPAARYLAQ